MTYLGPKIQLIPQYPRRTGRDTLIRKLKEAHVPYKCSMCQCKNMVKFDGKWYWRGRELTLDVDHINGVPYDNRALNLRYLCPNCHRSHGKNRQLRVPKPTLEDVMNRNTCENLCFMMHKLDVKSTQFKKPSSCVLCRALKQQCALCAFALSAI